MSIAWSPPWPGWRMADAALHVARYGAGPDLALVHGWGFDSRALQPLGERLATRFRVHAVDLPGHGRSPGPLPDDLARLAARVATALPAPAAWVGWSLGALVAWRVALDRPGAVTRLAAVAATPRFTRADDWPDAVDPATLAAFAAACAADPDAVLARFAGLVAHGDRHPRAVQRQLGALHAGAPRDGAALAAGLALLAASDLRAPLATLDLPTLCLLGGGDALLPAALAARLASAYPAWRIATVAGAGHAPFVAHADACAARITAFLDG